MFRIILASVAEIPTGKSSIPVVIHPNLLEVNSYVPLPENGSISIPQYTSIGL